MDKLSYHRQRYPSIARPSGSIPLRSELPRRRGHARRARYRRVLRDGPPSGFEVPDHFKVWGQKRSTRTIAQTIPQPTQVVLGWAACHS